MTNNKRGLNEAEMAKAMGITGWTLRIKTDEEKENLINDLYNQVKKLKDEGLSIIDISKIMNLKESSIRQMILNKSL